jgi:hypothetical protein
MVLDDIYRRELELERKKMFEELSAYKADMFIKKSTHFYLGFLLGELMCAIDITDDYDLHNGLLQEWRDRISNLYRLEEYYEG